MEKNELYPIFLKVHALNVTIIGGGWVGQEKLGFLLKSSPNAKVKMIAIAFNEEVKTLAAQHQVILVEKAYEASDLDGSQMIIAATNEEGVNIQIYHDAKSKNILVNVADNPPYCDFYMGGIVIKGNVKIAISTNGKSPTTAKRLRQFFEEVLPDDINKLVENLNTYRKTLKNDFESKVEQLNTLTEGLLKNKE
ncbi:bifunctional precorrin-2 dehydrogenase/sirohydrochlorin ferrochelatase [Zhouia sp. PK063]|uniref:bifunctional precorrin-2 dehydrogenase/sirohydrochlorin ferrochelatase n=1 Tax=Zhouia sp. PK063 TaxID=3373602 RepID=UPI0037B3FE9D